MNVYLFTGLGADERLFRDLYLGNAKTEFVKWPIPQQGEELSEYAKRISKQILAPNPVLLGVSFGGMVATEVAKTIPHQKLITISSANHPDQLPALAKLSRHIPLHGMAGFSNNSIGNWVVNQFMGGQTKENYRLLSDMLKDTHPLFLKGALNMLVNWRTHEPMPPATTIHGKNDLIIPARKDHNLLLPGGHAIILTKGSEISHYICHELGC